MASLTGPRPIRVTDDSGVATTIVPESGHISLGPSDARGAIRLGIGDGLDGEALVMPDHDGDDAHESESRTRALSRLEVVVDGWRFVLTIEDEEHAALRDRARRDGARLAHAAKQVIRSVIPGRVVGVDVVEGDTVAQGDRLLVVEAMKMQNEIRSPRDGTVVRVGVAAGGTVEIGSVLVELG
jgi:biotin carboxyl carrier protein